MLIEFSLTCISYNVWENFLNYGVHFPRKYIESVQFYSCPSSHKTLGRIFFKICFRQDERDRENYDLLYQNSIRKYEDDLEHKFIYILYDL